MNSGIENIFLTYANLPLIKHPEKLHEIFEPLKDPRIGFEEECVEEIFHYVNDFVIFAKSGNLKNARNIYKTMAEERNHWPPEHQRAAFRSLFYDFENDYKEYECNEACEWEVQRMELLGEELFNKLNRIRCFECDHLVFKMVLTGIAEEKEYSEIPFFKDFLVTRNLNFHIVVEPIHLSSNFPFKEVLQERAVFDPFANIYIRLHDDVDVFSQYIIMPIVRYSLAEFLVHNDRRKIKQCP
jgi:hypothetical protein